ncbi:MAG: DMT family transporter [Flavobacteriales bacterium]|uniref:DMT family transporter n=1 Tax=Candidatus Ulvibacter alkanivorans TaxID=2267620 RepID=UPI000DF2D4DD|nr:DMT family transporter [Candidatus Ulvibacter alkanivorans]MCH2490237.1 DMT family transporter [Flavobacteriales bacterium]
MNLRVLALLAAFAASAIYGVNHTIAKGLMPEVIQPYGFIMLRVTGAAVLFWIISLFFPSEKIASKDWLRVIGCAFFGMVLNMLMFFKGLSLSTPINSSVVITLAPVLLLILSAIFLKERITWLKSVGIGLGLVGALLLILFGLKTQPNAPNIPLGNVLFIVNAASYSIYLIMVKPLVSKYSSITLMKFFFLFAVFMNLPIGYTEFMDVAWTSLSFESIWKLAFVVVGTTVLTYLFNIYALKQLSPSTIGAFIYLQPLLAAFFAILMGADTLTPLRVLAALLIFTGVFLSTRKKKQGVIASEKSN